jgi:hypothetical protein
VTQAPADEVREFEELFGAMPEAPPPRPAGGPPAREAGTSGTMILRGRLTDAQLLTLYGEFVTRYRAHRGIPPPASFEQLALMIQNRYAQLAHRFPDSAVSVAVVLENDRIIVRLRPVSTPSGVYG